MESDLRTKIGFHIVVELINCSSEVAFSISVRVGKDTKDAFIRNYLPFGIVAGAGSF
jgi:hypothetical protein